MANIRLSVQKLCKTQCKNTGKTFGKLCVKNSLNKKCVQKYKFYTTFSNLFHFLFTTTPPLCLRNNIHISTAPTITTTNIINN